MSSDADEGDSSGISMRVSGFLFLCLGLRLVLGIVLERNLDLLWFMALSVSVFLSSFNFLITFSNRRRSRLELSVCCTSFSVVNSLFLSKSVVSFGSRCWCGELESSNPESDSSLSELVSLSVVVSDVSSESSLLSSCCRWYISSHGVSTTSKYSFSDDSSSDSEVSLHSICIWCFGSIFSFSELVFCGCFWNFVSSRCIWRCNSLILRVFMVSSVISPNGARDFNCSSD